MSSAIGIQNASALGTNVAIRQPPSHLITLIDKGANASKYFIALKHDKASTHVDATGFFITLKLTEAAIKEKYAELVSSTIANESEKIVEISFPWVRINDIQNLIYKHKGVKQ